MRRKDIETKILEAYEKAPLPDTLDETREKVLSAEPLPQEERRKAPRWKVLAPALAGGAAAIALLIALPFALQGEGNPDVSGSSSIPPVLTTLDEKEAGAFARQALSLVTLAEEEERSSLLMRQPLTEQDFRRIAGEIDGYIEMVEEFQRTDGLSISLLAGDTLIQVEDGELSLLIDYEEEKVSEELQRFSGTIESGDESYRFEGRVEEKGEETEVETILYLPDGSWIESEQEIEQGENEYSYAYYEKGATRPWREVEFEREVEGMEGESEIQIREGETTTSCSFEYRGEAMEDRFFAEYEMESPSEEEEASCLVERLEKGHRYTFVEEDGGPVIGTIEIS